MTTIPHAISRIGSAYGGWDVALGLIPSGVTILSCGIGNDFTFDRFLIEKRNCFVVMVDPNSVSIEALAVSNLPLKNYAHIAAALWTDELGVAFGAERSNGAGVYSSGRKVKIGTVTIDGLLAKHPRAALLKMDIEGAEYDCIAGARFDIRPAQIAVGFHTAKGSGDQRKAIEKLESLGYYVASVEDEGPEIVNLFIRKDI